MMQNYKEFYILGLPIETKFGKCRFVKVKEYPDFLIYQNLLSISKDKILKIYEMKQDDGAKNIPEELPLFMWICLIPDFKKLYELLFDFVFEEKGVFDKIENENDFDNIRKLIMDMNCIKEEKEFKNPELQSWIEKKKKLKSEEIDIRFEDVVSSIVAYTGHTYEQVNEMTIYQLYMTFNRIAQFKRHDATTLFRTVSNDVNIESWCKHIDLNIEKEEEGMSREEFEKLRRRIE